MGRVIVGVDPGLSGACVAISDKRIVDAIEMPVLALSDRMKRVHAAQLSQWFSDMAADLVVIERVWSMPGQGVSSMFTFGHSCGVIDGIVGALGISTMHVLPQKWKKRIGLIGNDKDAVRAWATQMFPESDLFFTKKRGQAMADALGIAWSVT